jgi:hypothetical protein
MTNGDEGVLEVAWEKCALFAEGVRLGSPRKDVWDDLIIVPSGNVMDSGCKAFFLLTQDDSNARKSLLHRSPKWMNFIIYFAG